MRRGIVKMTPQAWNVSDYRSEIAREFLIVKIEFMDYENNYWLLIEDERLDLVNEGCQIPQYGIVFKLENNKIVFDKIGRV